MSVPAVLGAITQIIAALGKEGISKDRKNVQQGYMFRGIDDIYNALSPLLAEHQLVIVPRMLTRDVWERESAKGNALFYVVVTAEFDFVSAVDGSMVTARTFGEGMDSADKATNKAMSAAYKYAAFQTFAIPTEAVDSEFDSHDVKGKPSAGSSAAGQSRAGGPPRQAGAPAPAAAGTAAPTRPTADASRGSGGGQPTANAPRAEAKGGPPGDPPPEGSAARPSTTQSEPRKRPIPSGDSEIDRLKFDELSEAIKTAADETTLKRVFLDAYQFAADIDDDRISKPWQMEATKLKDARKAALGIK